MHKLPYFYIFAIANFLVFLLMFYNILKINNIKKTLIFQDYSRYQSLITSFSFLLYH